MKKTLLISIILSVLLTGIASAQSSSSTSRIEAIKQKIAEIRLQAVEDKEMLKAQIASGTANLKQELKTNIEIRIGKKLDTQKLKIVNVFENSIQNLKDLIKRIESRIAKMEADNTDVSLGKTLLDTAKTKVSVAEIELTNLANLLAQNIPPVGTSTTINIERKTILKNIKNQSEKTKTTIKTAHKSIIDVVNSLKPGLIKEGVSTSTESTSTIIN